MSFEIKQDVPLAPYTTLRIGGLARYFVSVKTEDKLVEACNWAKEKSQKVFVLGGGSNVLISDEGFDGLVILVDIKGRSYVEDIDRQEIVADIKAGEVWDDFVLESVNKGYYGVECLSGIPGRVGASIVQNIGAYGQEVCEVVERVRYYDIEAQKFREYSNIYCSFDYRASIFKGKSDKVVTAVRFKLSTTGRPAIKNKGLADKLVDKIPTPGAVREAVLELRRSNSMLVDPKDPNSVSAGSFFKNPVITGANFEKIKEKYPDAPNWPQEDGLTKLSAGWLIEKSGLPKGFVYSNGKVRLSQKHALAIINRGSAKAADVYEFAKYIQQEVQSVFGVKLEPEVVYVGNI